MRRGVAVVAAAAVLSAVPVMARAVGTAVPCGGSMRGGEWSTYGEDLQGTQRQLADNGINQRNVSHLKAVWSSADTSAQSAPPIVWGGCVYINAGGHIEALDLQTGAVRHTSGGSVDTSGTFAPTIVGKTLFVGVQTPYPHAAAFDASTLGYKWESGDITLGSRYSKPNQESSAIVFDGMLVLFTTGPDFDTNSNAGYAIIDAATGAILVKRPTVPPELFAQGYRGGGAWGTPTIDPKTKYLYVGTANPNSKTKESEYDNAVIKLDLDTARPTFGKIVGTYNGDSDSITGYDNPVCQSTGGTVWYNAGVYGGAPTCGQTDVDFGVGPTLWRDATGRLHGALTQKSGNLHIFNADDMSQAAHIPLGTSLSFAAGDIARIATDGSTIYVPATPGFLWAFDANPPFGRKWVVPLAGVPPKGGNAALNNHVLFYVDDLVLKAFDPATGALLWASPPQPGASIGSGVAIAGNTVVANHYGKTVAYRVGG